MKIKKCLFSIVLTIFFIFSVYLIQISNVKIIRLPQTFTFLTLQTDGIESCITQTKLDGGAGFLLKTRDGEKVALAVYLQEKDAILVKERLSKNLRFLKIDKKQPSALYFKGFFQKQKAKAVYGAFVNLYTIIQGLESAQNQLSSGGTQENCKRQLSALSKYLHTLSQSYEMAFKHFSSVCEQAAKSFEQCQNGICYVQDLRYLLCQLCEEYVALSNEFKI